MYLEESKRLVIWNDIFMIVDCSRKVCMGIVELFIDEIAFRSCDDVSCLTGIYTILQITAYVSFCSSNHGRAPDVLVTI